jgi:hypothetical protein
MPSFRVGLLARSCRFAKNLIGVRSGRERTSVIIVAHARGDGSLVFANLVMLADTAKPLSAKLMTFETQMVNAF